MARKGRMPEGLRVREPQMPKGVEHPRKAAPPAETLSCENLRCRKALSTCTCPGCRIQRPRVREPQMPKGVEHT